MVEPSAAPSDAGVAASATPARKGAEALALYKIAYDEGRRRVDDQLTELADMRNRAVQFLALSATAAAFLVGTSLRDADRDNFFYLLAIGGSAIAVLALVLTLRVLLGWKKVWRLRHDRYSWRFRISAARLVGWAQKEVPPAPSENAFTKELALEYEEMYKHNSPQLKALRNTYAVAITLGFVQMLVWGALVWARA